ncbi:MAG TPA: PEP-CTERM sorting domain-containing protein [Candidatus Acidoferrum sp.]|jgi:hypothetical protein|nr:PEP-CTERM sorting domain-containing protein [Candidatus Acidoferrum sp.]
MNKLTKSALLAAGVALVTQAAQAYTANDMLLGFNSTAPNEYVIDLGNVRTAFGSSSVLNLSSDFNLTTFNSTFAGGPNGVNMGAAGAASGLTPSIYLTQLRSGGAGNPAVAGSTTPASVSSSIVGQGAGDVSAVANAPYNLTAGGQSATGPTSGSTSFFTKIAPTSSSGSWLGQSSINVLGQIASSVVYEDVYAKSGSAAWVYEGVLALDLTGTPSLTFTPNTVAVPEPTTYGLLAGAGLLVLSLRRQFSSKNA